MFPRRFAGRTVHRDDPDYVNRNNISPPNFVKRNTCKDVSVEQTQNASVDNNDWLDARSDECVPKSNSRILCMPLCVCLCVYWGI